MFAEDFLGDVGDAFVLEDTAVGGTGQKPEPGARGQLILVEFVLGFLLGYPENMAMEIAFVAVGEIQTQGDSLAEQRFEVDIGFEADGIDVDVERPAQGFVNTGFGQQQLVRPSGVISSAKRWRWVSCGMVGYAIPRI